MLNFTIYFWCEVTRPLDRRMLKPLEVRMVEGETKQASGDSK